MELQYRLQPGEMKGVGEHLRVSLRSRELVATGGKVWILHDPAQSAAQSGLFPRRAIDHRRKKKRPQRSSQNILKTVLCCL